MKRTHTGATAMSASVAAAAAAAPTIGTHSGSFQADEALGCALLRMTEAYAESPITRSRDPAVLATKDIVIDVGGVYDPSVRRYDHHQRGFFETFDGPAGEAKPGTGKFKVRSAPPLLIVAAVASSRPSHRRGRRIAPPSPALPCPAHPTPPPTRPHPQTPLSASGLVYKHFGCAIIARLHGTDAADTALLHAKVYSDMMEGIDGIDSGVEQCETKPRYREGTGLSARVARMNPRWNEESTDADLDARFAAAVEVAGADFRAVLEKAALSWLPARGVVTAAIAARESVDPSGEVVLFASGGVPWRDHVYDLEREAGVEGLVKFVLYPDQSGMWRVQAVTVEGAAFTNRISLPEAWCGVRGDDLTKVSGIAGCCFAHANGFIGGNETQAGALAMALAAIKGV